MRIGIDFDDTIVETTKKIHEYVKKYNLEFFDTLNSDFYIKYIEEITNNIDLKPNVLKILNKLIKDNELYLITARNEYYSKNIPKLILKFINDNKLPFKEIHFDCYGETKASKCKELGINLFIDDCIDNCIPVKKIGIDTLLFQNEYEGLKTVNSWDEVLEYMEEMYGRKDSN